MQYRWLLDSVPLTMIWAVQPFTLLSSSVDKYIQYAFLFKILLRSNKIKVSKMWSLSHFWYLFRANLHFLHTWSKSSLDFPTNLSFINWEEIISGEFCRFMNKLYLCTWLLHQKEQGKGHPVTLIYIKGVNLDKNRNYDYRRNYQV